jgi:hypothetical protein
MVEFTAPSAAVNPIDTEQKVPFIYDALVKKFVDENPYAFKMYFDVGNQCGVAAQYLADHGYKHLAGFSVDLDFDLLDTVEENKQLVFEKVKAVAVKDSLTNTKTLYPLF